MTESTREQLSAFLDGELPAREAELLLRRIAADGGDIRNDFARYLLIGEAMRAGRGVTASPGFAERVGRSVALEAEPVAVPGRPRRRSWLRPVAGLAVAAGVAAVAVLSLRVETPETAGVAATGGTARPLSVTAANIEPAGDAAPSSYVVPASIGRGAVVPAARLTNYVVAHSEFSSPLGRRNVLTGILAGDALESAPDRIEDDTDSDDDHAAPR